MKWRTKSPPNQAFTLVELIITIVLVSIISVPLSLFLAEHVASLSQSEDYSIAINLARFEMEKVNNLDYDNVVSASFPNYESSGYDVTRTVTYAYGSGSSAESLKEIDVEVRKSGDTNILVNFVTYRADNVSLGA